MPKKIRNTVTFAPSLRFPTEPPGREGVQVKLNDRLRDHIGDSARTSLSGNTGKGVQETLISWNGETILRSVGVSPVLFQDSPDAPAFMRAVS